MGQLGIENYERCVTYGPQKEHTAYVIDTPVTGEAPVDRFLNVRCAKMRRSVGQSVVQAEIIYG